MKYFFCFLFVSFSFITHAQFISGLYSGTLVNDSTKKVQAFELALSEYKDKITGYSYTTFIVNDTFYYSVKRVKAARENGELVVEDVQMLMNNFPESPAKKVRQTVTVPIDVKEDTVQNMKGRWKTNQTKVYYSLHGNLDMKRANDSTQSALINHLEELRLVNYQDSDEDEKGIVRSKNKNEKASAVRTVSAKTVIEKPVATPLPFDQRATNIIQTLNVQSDSLVLSFYDNGVVDGDTISVYLNRENIISKTKLTAVAAKKKVLANFDQEDELKLTLVAENLGTIPPNTGLLVIEDGNQKYQIRFSADMQNNAAIIFRKKKQ